MEPIAVRYAWQDSPIANLLNKKVCLWGLSEATFENTDTGTHHHPLVLKTGGTPDKPEVFDE